MARFNWKPIGTREFFAGRYLGEVARHYDKDGNDDGYIIECQWWGNQKIKSMKFDVTNDKNQAINNEHGLKMLDGRHLRSVYHLLEPGESYLLIGTYYSSTRYVFEYAFVGNPLAINQAGQDLKDLGAYYAEKEKHPLKDERIPDISFVPLDDIAAIVKKHKLVLKQKQLQQKTTSAIQDLINKGFTF